MRALSVIHYPFFGGPHNQALRLSDPLRRHGIETLVLLPDEEGNAVARLEAGGVTTFRRPLRRLRAMLDVRAHLRLLRGFRADVRMIENLLRDERIDVVVLHGLVNVQAALAARRANVALVWQLLDTRAPRLLRVVLAPFVARLADVVMTTGLGVARVHPGVSNMADRLVTFVPPVDTSEFRPEEGARKRARRELGIPSDAIVVGSVANLTPQKGLEHMVAAAHLVSAARPDIHFLLLGRPMETHDTYAEMVHAAAAPLIDVGSLTVHDPGSRVSDLIRALDIFVISSVPRSEGISTTAVEAMAAGIPVITTDVGALNEVVEDGVTGFVVRPLDAAALANAILELIDDNESRLAMGREARRRAEDAYDVEVCARRHSVAFSRAVELRTAAASGGRR